MASTMILAVDIGTSSCKGCGFDSSSLLPITKWHKRGYDGDVTSPQSWFVACFDILEAILAESSDDKPPSVVVLSGMMQNVIVTSDSSKCIMYNDSAYALKAHDYLTRKGHAAKIKKLTGNYKESASVPAKLAQLQRDRKFKSRQTVLFGAHSYVAWRLLNIGDEGALCDPTTASTTGLLQNDTGAWLSQANLTAFGLGNFAMPRLLSSASRVVGHIHLPDRLDHRLNGLPLVHGSGDLGSLVAAVDRWGFHTHAYLGTSGWIARVVTKSNTARSDVFVLAHPLDATKVVHAMPTTCAGFNATKWSSTLFDDQSLAHFDSRAEQVLTKSELVMYLPHLKGERAPIAMPHARASFLGLTSDTTRDDMALAVLTGVAYQYRWLLASFGENAQVLGANGKLCLLGGGSASSIWRQVFADVLNVTVKSLSGRNDMDETVWGAACIAQQALKGDFPEAMWALNKPREGQVKLHNQRYPIWLRAAEGLCELFAPPVTGARPRTKARL